MGLRKDRLILRLLSDWGWGIEMNCFMCVSYRKGELAFDCFLFVFWDELFQIAKEVGHILHVFIISIKELKFMY